MKISVKIDGMMCEHCEKHMKEAFLKLDGVTDAVCDHNKKEAIIEMNDPIDKDVLKKTVEEAGYIYID